MSGTSVYILLILISVTISPNYKQMKVSTNTPITFFSRNLHVLKGKIFKVAFLESENLIIIINLTGNGLSPGGSGYNTCT